jgi:hypothetical protein
MKRWLVAMILALAASPALAQEAKPAWYGVWKGTVGQYAIMACLDVDGEAGRKGSYYYSSMLLPIALRDFRVADGELERDLDYLVESDGLDKNEARWTALEVKAGRLTGTWSQGERSLPLSLRPIVWNPGESGGPCDSEAYFGQRLAEGSVRWSEASLDGWAYRVLAYEPGAHFAPNLVQIASFALAEARPGDAAINAALSEYIPKGTMKDPLFQCLSWNVAMMGLDGDFQQWVAPEMISRDWLTVLESNSSYCGGVHPNHWQVWRMFDRRTGAEAKPWLWLTDTALTVETYESGWIRSELKPVALKQVLARWPAEMKECIQEAEYTASWDWDLGLHRDGIAFRPDLPHAATPCEEAITVPWDVLAPYLTEAGKTVRAEVEAN